MGDAIQGFRDLAQWRKERRERLGVKCPTCTKERPKGNATILLPQQRCRVCGYRDPRPDQD